MNDILINKAQRLYVIKAGGGYTCLGLNMLQLIADWLVAGGMVFSFAGAVWLKYHI